MTVSAPATGKQIGSTSITPRSNSARKKRRRLPLEHTFLHLPGIGTRMEHRLWQNGFRTWDDLERKQGYQLSLFGKSRWEAWLEGIEASRHALSSGDAEFFAVRLPTREHYRIAATFPEETVFLDIETTGLSLYYDKITLIGLSQGNRYLCHMPEAKGARSTTSSTWMRVLGRAKCLVTFNGTMFDIKFLLKSYPDLVFPSAHVDLRFLARRVALTGGQKSIEDELGLARPKGIQGVSGLGAVVLWYEYQAGNRDAGRRLVRYNHADIEGMKVILDEVTGRMLQDDRSAPMPHQTAFARSRSSIRFRGKATPAKKSHYVRIPRTPMRHKPAVDCAQLLAAIPNSDFRVVGIDLTGSERRPTGWCHMEGARAETRLIRSDQEILNEIQAVKPHLVSIDSPLSLPAGRTRAFDDDPGRIHFGIMRGCERTLKRRGINVYPCLIPSMQNLTARGIRLSNQIRSTGIPVIESYPGAAQDIMKIPRKRASLSQLKEGLLAFGVIGDFGSTKVTHDEVDAVTSAVVGLFFWSGCFEALGNEVEDYLIVPDLSDHSTPGVNEFQQRVVGFSGAICTGKTTAARQLETRGFTYGRYSQVLEDLLRKRKSRITRVSLQRLGSRIHNE